MTGIFHYEMDIIQSRSFLFLKSHITGNYIYDIIFDRILPLIPLDNTYLRPFIFSFISSSNPEEETSLLLIFDYKLYISFNFSKILG